MNEPKHQLQGFFEERVGDRRRKRGKGRKRSKRRRKRGKELKKREDFFCCFFCGELGGTPTLCFGL